MAIVVAPRPAVAQTDPALEADIPLEAELTLEGLRGFRPPIRLKGSLVEGNLRLSAGALKLEGMFNGGKVTGSYQLNTTGGTFALTGR